MERCWQTGIWRKQVGRRVPTVLTVTRLKAKEVNGWNKRLRFKNWMQGGLPNPHLFIWILCKPVVNIFI